MLKSSLVCRLMRSRFHVLFSLYAVLLESVELCVVMNGPRRSRQLGPKVDCRACGFTSVSELPETDPNLC